MPTWLIYFLTAVCAFNGIVEISNAVEMMREGLLQYHELEGQWYDKLIAAAIHGALAGCLISYAIKRRRREQSNAALPQIRWKDRTEQRLALYIFAAAALLSVPLQVADVMVKRHSDSSAGSFGSEFQYGYFAYWIFAAALIGYDQWKLVHDTTVGHKSRCIKCGYDLRATPERCPECGTVPEPNSATPIQS